MNNVFIPDKKGQAILELAVFGAILIMLLGVLISYGLRYEYQQLSIQRSFRQALGTSAYSTKTNKPISVSHTLIENRHIPDPTQPFAIGTITPISSTAGVTRSAELHKTPDNPNELGVMTYHIDGKNYTFKAAEIRIEEDMMAPRIDRYLLVYGSTVQAYNASMAGGPWVYWENGTRECMEYGPPDPWDGSENCTLYRYERVRYIDDCAGEIMTYEAALKQCRKILDSAVCEEDCDRQGGADCPVTCSQEMAVPWYCGTDYEEIDPAKHTYVFPFLDRMFAFAKGENKDKAMGVQEDYLQKDRSGATLRETNNPTRAETRDKITINTTIERKMVSRTYGDTSTNSKTQTIATNTKRKQDRIWRTPWDTVTSVSPSPSPIRGVRWPRRRWW